MPVSYTHLVLGVAILVIQKEFTYAESLMYAVSIGIGFLLAMVIFAGIREQLAKTGSTPRAMKGTPIALIPAGILAMAFMAVSYKHLPTFSHLQEV